MSQPYVGEIRLFAGNFAPAGWGFCDGSLQAIAENETLFQLIGTTYGGDGQNTFALPDLRSRFPVHMGSLSGVTYQIGEPGGVEQVTLNSTTLPLHNHAAGCTDAAGNNANPAGGIPAVNAVASAYGAVPPNVGMNPAIIGNAGGNQPHNNIQPYLCVSFIISFFGIFPSPN
jgi:microcystin-dependent protein